MVVYDAGFIHSSSLPGTNSSSRTVEKYVAGRAHGQHEIILERMVSTIAPGQQTGTPAEFRNEYPLKTEV